MYEYENVAEALRKLIETEIPESAKRGGDVNVLAKWLARLEEIQQDVEDVEES